MIVLNDIHLGVQRAAGTTPASALALRHQLQQSFAQFVAGVNEPLLINGDLFDGYDADRADLLQCFHTLRQFSCHHPLFLVAGNHDLSKDSHKLSSFELLCQLLVASNPEYVNVIMRPTGLLNAPIYVIPHLVNQTEMDEAIAYFLEDVVPGAKGAGEPFKFCLFHANYDNHFAAQSDHSLNVSQDQALALIAAGVMPVFGHEHPKRVVDLGDGDVLCTGNQWPSSTSDCINIKGKFAHRLHNNGNYEAIQTWNPAEAGGYFEIDWRDADTFHSNAGFVRVTGEATFDEAGEVVTAVAHLRQRSDAFVVTNAVKTAGAGDDMDLSETAEVAHKTDVVKLLLEVLDEKEAARVKEVLSDDQ